MKTLSEVPVEQSRQPAAVTSRQALLGAEVRADRAECRAGSRCGHGEERTEARRPRSVGASSSSPSQGTCQQRRDVAEQIRQGRAEREGQEEQAPKGESAFCQELSCARAGGSTVPREPWQWYRRSCQQACRDRRQQVCMPFSGWREAGPRITGPPAGNSVVIGENEPPSRLSCLPGVREGTARRLRPAPDEADDAVLRRLVEDGPDRLRPGRDRQAGHEACSRCCPAVSCARRRRSRSLQETRESPARHRGSGDRWR